MKLFLKNWQSPGDILMLTAAVRDLHRACPSIRIGVSTSAGELWSWNPLIDWNVTADNADRVIDLEYPLIHQSDRLPYHFIHAFRKELELQLGLRIPQGEFKGDLYLSDEEKTPHPLLGGEKDYWIIDAGYKLDFTLKNWGHSRYRRVVELLAGKVRFVQIGADEPTHKHAALPGVINIVGKTKIRDFIRIMYGAAGVLTPVSFPMHLAAAVPTADGRLRPCVVVAGAREPSTWEAYPGHVFLHNVGAFDCCRAKSCWRSRAVQLGDREPSDRSLCDHPVTENGESVGRCMAAITPEVVAGIIEMYHNNR